MAKFVSTYDIVIEIECAREIHSLSQREVKRLINKLELLRTPAHPSLSVHKAQGTNDLFIAYWSVNNRIVFQRDGNLIRVVSVGPHEVVDRHRLRSHV